MTGRFRKGMRVIGLHMNLMIGKQIDLNLKVFYLGA